MREELERIVKLRYSNISQVVREAIAAYIHDWQKQHDSS